MSALRQALEQAGTDKNALRDLLTKEKEQSGYLNIQLLEERHKNRIEKDKVREDLCSVCIVSLYVILYSITFYFISDCLCVFFNVRS